jgi:calcineurin-like phosphoesterase family protein
MGDNNKMNTLKLDSKKQRIWFVSDAHYCHAKPFILDPRGYSSVKEAMDDFKQKWKQYISPNDIVINLGDQIVGAGMNTRQYVFDLLALPYAHQYFVWGNHNAGMNDLYAESMAAEGHDTAQYEIYPWTLKDYPFTFLGNYAEIVIDHQHVTLCHYPITSWNHTSKGAFMLHGHCHGNLKDDKSQKRLDIGWDYDNRPLEWSEIVRELSNRKGLPVDHHGTAEFIVNENKSERLSDHFET